MLQFSGSGNAWGPSRFSLQALGGSGATGPGHCVQLRHSPFTCVKWNKKLFASLVSQYRHCVREEEDRWSER